MDCEICIETKRIIEDFRVKKDDEAVRVFQEVLKSHQESIIHE